VAIQVVASPEEHQLVTTKPSELLAMEKEVVAPQPKSPKTTEVPPRTPRGAGAPPPPAEDEFQRKIREQLKELDRVKEKAKTTLSERFAAENLSRRATPSPNPSAP